VRRPQLQGLWREPEFLKLWGGESVSQVGAQITQLALPLAAVYELHVTPGQLGALNAASFAPFLAVALFIGVWVDRRRRRPLMIAANAGRALLVGSVPLASALGLLRIEYLVLVAFAIGTLTVLFDVSYQSYLPSLVDREQLVEGNSKLQATASIAQIGGPGLAGVLIGIAGAPVALLVNVGSYVASVASLAAIRRPEPNPAPAAVQLSTRRSIGEGMRLILRAPVLRACAFEAGTYNLCWMALQTVFVLYAVRVLHLSATAIGILFAVGASGSLVGAAGTSLLKQRLGLGRAVMAALVICCCAPALIPLAPHARAGALAVDAAALFLAGAGATAANIQILSLRQAMTPHHLLGRVNAGYRFLCWGPLPLGALIGGFLAGEIGLHATLSVTAVGFVLALAWVVFSPVPRLTDFPLAPEVATAPA
jgi:MFS family permease